MVKMTNYTTFLLVLIVLILLVGVGIAVYYVLDLDWFEKLPVQIYNEQVVKPYEEKQPQTEVKIEKKIAYDITKRAYNLELNTDELKVVVYKDGTVGITMKENEKYKDITSYTTLLNKESKLTLNNIVRTYEVEVLKEQKGGEYVILLDSEGNLYELVEQELINSGKYAFVKIEGLAKIIDVRQITNDNLTDNIEGVNAIAIDEESNELLLTEYLLKNEK